MKNCTVCSGHINAFIKKEDLLTKADMYICSECGLVFFEEKQDSHESQIDDNYWSDKQKAVYKESQIKDTFAEEFKKRLDNIEKFIRPPAKVLDVGCGIGSFLHSAQERGWNVKGVDISKPASELAKELYGIDVAVDFLEEADYPPNSFDIITMWDVIEHVRSPLPFLSAAHRFLRTGGILVMKTPNDKGFFKALSRFIYRVSFGKINFHLKYVYYLPHFYSYNPENISVLLEKTGFKMIKVESDETDFRFALSKIKAHYKYPERLFIILFLPFAYLAARILKRPNKMIVYAVRR